MLRERHMLTLRTRPVLIPRARLSLHLQVHASTDIPAAARLITFVPCFLGVSTLTLVVGLPAPSAGGSYRGAQARDHVCPLPRPPPLPGDGGHDRKSPHLGHTPSPERRDTAPGDSQHRDISRRHGAKCCQWVGWGAAHPGSTEGFTYPSHLCRVPSPYTV